MRRKDIVVTLLASAAVLVMTGCSFNGASPVSAESTPVVSPGTTVPGQAATLLTNQNAGRVITVVGSGQAAGAPDVANVSIGVDTQSGSVQQAVADNRAKMTKLLEALVGLGIAEKDISTSNYSVYTEQQSNPAGATSVTPTLTYRVNNQVNVVVRDVSRLGNVLDTVVTAGANNVYGVNFSVADTSKLEGDARAKAMADAKARAESLANLAGVNLGDVMSVSEVVGGSMPAMRLDAAASGGGTPIQPGTLNVNMSVQVTYAIQ